MIRTVITGTGCYLPKNAVSNSKFHNQRFYDLNGEPIPGDGETITEKFVAITGIRERRYTDGFKSASSIATIAAQEAIADAGIDPEMLDEIIVAHNFGDVLKDTVQTDILPALAARVKHNLGIKNPKCVAYDILFGCPGWIQGVIQGHKFIQAGMAKRILVIGAETLSRVLDHSDRDSMIFSDGAGASILEAVESDKEIGILSFDSMSHTLDEAYYLYMGPGNAPDSDPDVRYIKMHGRKIYEYAMKNVPMAMKETFDQTGLSLFDLKKVFLHQANEKMDEGIIQRFYRLYKERNLPEHIMPMSIHELGNSSVATVPTLYDRTRKGELANHVLNSGDVVLFASVGAGMHINAIAYREP